MSPNRFIVASPRGYDRASIRLGMTLIELLVVIGVLSLLAGIALPNVRNLLREQRVSRAAGLVQSYIEGARAKAIGEGRPYGILIQRAGTDSPIGRAQSLRLSYVNSPPPYTGDLVGAKAVVLDATNPEGHLAFRPSEATMIEAAFSQQAHNPIIRPNDLIGLGTNPRYFKIRSLGQLSVGQPMAGWHTVLLVPQDAAKVRGHYGTDVSVPFRILRAPTPSVVAPLDLPQGTVVDLVYSGVGLNGDDFSPLAIENRRQDAMGNLINNRYGASSYTAGTSTPMLGGMIDFQSVVILFNSQGSVSEIRYGDPDDDPAKTVALNSKNEAGNIFLLIGKTGSVFPEDPFLVQGRDQANLMDFESVWIVINRQTGNVTTAPIAPFSVSGGGTVESRLQMAIQTSRSIAAEHGEQNI